MHARIAAAVVVLSLMAVPVLAEDTPKEAKHKSGTTKMWVGLGLLVVGGSMAGTSHQSASSTVLGTTFEASATSTPQLVAGLAIAGGGGFILWNGLNERSEADRMPSTRWSLSVGKRNGLFVRRMW